MICMCPKSDVINKLLKFKENVLYFNKVWLISTIFHSAIAFSPYRVTRSFTCQTKVNNIYVKNIFWMWFLNFENSPHVPLYLRRRQFALNFTWRRLMATNSCAVGMSRNLAVSSCESRRFVMWVNGWGIRIPSKRKRLEIQNILRRIWRHLGIRKKIYILLFVQTPLP